MVRVQIAPLPSGELENAAEIMKSCAGGSAYRQLNEYLGGKQYTVLGAWDGVLCGIICMMTTSDSADILDIAVHTDYRRRGIASALMSRADGLCRERGIKSMLLEVRVGNAPARALYQKLGFDEISVRKGYYTSPTEDAVVYIKYL